MGKKKKIVSLIVSVAMLVAMFPMIVHADGNPYTVGTWDYLQYELSHSDTVALTSNYTAGADDSCLIVDRRVNLLLNGYTIDRGLSNGSAADDGHVIKVKSGGSLSISPTGNGGTITGGNALSGGGLYVEAGGSINLMDVTITGNKVDEYGYGAGIYIEGGSTSNIFTSTDGFGSVYVMNNGGAGYGGGIFNAGELTLGTGTIAGNNASMLGGGIFDAGTLTLCGDVTITGNKGEGNKDNDLYLTSGKKISASYDADGSFIGISTADVPQDGKPVVFTTGIGNNVKESNFVSNDGFTIEKSGGELQLVAEGSSIVSGVAFKGCSLSLDGSIHLVAYFDLNSLTDAQKESARVTFVVPGKGANTQPDVSATRTFTNQYYSGNTLVTEVYDGFDCNLSAVQMAENVKATLMYDGAETPVEATCSVQSYFDAYSVGQALVDKSNTHASELIQAAGNFGYYLQPWLASVKGWTIGEGGYAAMSNLFNKTYSETDYTTALGDLDATQYPVSKDITECPDIERVQLSLEFDTTNSILVYFTLKDGSEEKLKASCEYGGKVFKAGKMDDGRYRIRISGISALSFDETFVISGTCGGDFSVTVSPLGYVRLGLKNHTSGSFTAKENAMMAIYEYWKYAEAYVQG